MSAIEDFGKCKITSQSQLELMLPKINTGSSLELSLIEVIKFNEQCIATGTKALEETKGNKLEVPIAKAVKSSIDRMKVDNVIYKEIITKKDLILQKDPTTLDNLRMSDYNVKRLVRDVETAQWDKLTYEIKKSSGENPYPFFKTFGFTGFILFIGIMVWVYAEAKRREKIDQNKNK